MKRESGILLSITSLPSRYGIGCFSKEAYEFVDRLKEAGQSYWQILPLGPTSYGDSPYQSFSTIAGNPYFISLEDLIQEGVLTEEECSRADFGSRPDFVDYAKVYEERYPLLRKAYERSSISLDPEFRKFRDENRWWLEDYALFMAVKARFKGTAWTRWAQDIRLRWQNALDYYRRELYYDIEFHQYLQFKFSQQWKKLKTYANANGIRIIGDIPIYVAMDSADTWAHPELFELDRDNIPTAVAGCPPDGFSATGQLWGNPLYRWEYHRSTGYEWWLARLSYCYKLSDVVRIDHFRGFDSYYAIPGKDTTARNGVWRNGPGMELFRAVEEKLGKLDIIVEDLGFLTPSVLQLVADSGYPGMKVVQFAFDSRDDSDYMPHNYDKHCVVYTGTHDNDTILGWMKQAPKNSVKKAKEYLRMTKEEGYNWGMMCGAWMSSANLAVVTMQDLIGLGSSARMNIPSTLGGNWTWRALPGQINAPLANKLHHKTELYGRLRR